LPNRHVSGRPEPVDFIRDVFDFICNFRLYGKRFHSLSPYPKKNVTRERVTGGLHARIGVAIVV
jgi:hypothetical protein